MANVRGDRSPGGACVITIDREEKRNALDRQTLTELEAAFDPASADPDVRVIVLRGTGLESVSPAALRLGKEAIYTMCEMESATAMRYLREMIVLTSMTDDAKEGIRAFFDKREPQWTGR